MIILVDEEGKKVLGALIDTFLKTNGLGVHNQVNTILNSARDLSPVEVAKEMELRKPSPIEMQAPPVGEVPPKVKATPKKTAKK